MKIHVNKQKLNKMADLWNGFFEIYFCLGGLVPDFSQDAAQFVVVTLKIWHLRLEAEQCVIFAFHTPGLHSLDQTTIIYLTEAGWVDSCEYINDFILCYMFLVISSVLRDHC